MDKLVLCHPPCNRLLKDLLLVEKIKMREKRCHERWKAEMRKRIAEKLIV
jgi:hypothetical protein